MKGPGKARRPIPKRREYTLYLAVRRGMSIAAAAAHYGYDVLSVIEALDSWHELRPQVRAYLRALAAGQETDTR